MRSLGEVMDALRHPVAAPDQTAAIMSRLGFVRASCRERRRRERRRLAARCTTVVSTILLLGAALAVYGASDLVRRPQGTPLPAALREDLLRQQLRFDGAIRTIRHMADPQRLRTPLEPSPPARESAGERIERPAVGPVRWI